MKYVIFLLFFISCSKQVNSKMQNKDEDQDIIMTEIDNNYINDNSFSGSSKVNENVVVTEIYLNQILVNIYIKELEHIKKCQNINFDKWLNYFNESDLILYSKIAKDLKNQKKIKILKTPLLIDIVNLIGNYINLFNVVINKKNNTILDIVEKNKSLYNTIKILGGLHSPNIISRKIKNFGQIPISFMDDDQDFDPKPYSMMVEQNLQWSKFAESNLINEFIKCAEYQHLWLFLSSPYIKKIEIGNKSFTNFANLINLIDYLINEYGKFLPGFNIHVNHSCNLPKNQILDTKIINLGFDATLYDKTRYARKDCFNVGVLMNKIICPDCKIKLSTKDVIKFGVYNCEFYCEKVDQNGKDYIDEGKTNKYKVFEFRDPNNYNSILWSSMSFYINKN